MITITMEVREDKRFSQVAKIVKTTTGIDEEIDKLKEVLKERVRIDF